MTTETPPQPCTQPSLEWAFWSPLKSRNSLADLLNERGLLGYAAEIGTHRGEFAASFLSTWKGQQLWCIDPWLDNLPEYGDFKNRDRRQDLEAARGALACFGRRAYFCIETSAAAAASAFDHSMDFVYIDANHAEPFVRQDIALWWPIVKPGGMLAGHDILKCGKEVDAGIQRAVRDFSVREGVDVWIVREDSDPNFPWSWYAWKEERKGG